MIYQPHYFYQDEAAYESLSNMGWVKDTTEPDGIRGRYFTLTEYGWQNVAAMRLRGDL